MKKYILLTLAVTAFLDVRAQMPVLYPRDGRLDGYYYPYWYDECLWYSDTTTLYELSPTDYHPKDPWVFSDLTWMWDSAAYMFGFARGAETEYPIAITGLAVMKSMNPYLSDRSLGHEPARPEYVMILQKTSDSLIVLDSARWDTAAPKILMLPKNRDSLGLTDTNGLRSNVRGYFQCYLYEVNLPRRVVVDSVYYLVGTFHSNEDDPWKNELITGYPFGYQYLFGGTTWYPWHYYDCTYPDSTTLRNYRYSFRTNTFVLLWETPFVSGPYLTKVNFSDLQLQANHPEWGTVETPGSRSDSTWQTITAIPNYGYRFHSWNDGDTNNPRQIFFTQDTLFTANFIPIGLHMVTVRSNDEAFGEVAGGGIFETGDSTMISATPRFGHRFIRWDDGDTNNPRKVYVSHDTTFTAIFRYIGIYTLTLRSNDSVFVKLYGNGVYEGGDSTVIRARFILHNSELDTTSQFWMVFRTWDDGVTSNPRKICITKDSVITAIYEITSPNGIVYPDGTPQMFTLTPNPARETVEVTLAMDLGSMAANSQKPTITVTDMLGRRLMQTPVAGNGHLTIDLRRFAPGVYLVTLKTPQGSSSARLTVQ